QALAARPRGVAAAIPRLVARDGAAWVPGPRRLSPHRRLGRCERLGAFRLRAHAGVPLGHLPRRAGLRSSHRLWQRLQEAGVAGGARRAPQYPSPPDRHAGRHRARLGRADAPARRERLLAFADSGFDPLSRTCRFMLTEEAHHMFVGESGVARIVERTAECLRAGKDPRAAGAIDLATIQRYLNRWYSVSLDLFGGEISTNAAQFFGAGLKGRPKEQE